MNDRIARPSFTTFPEASTDEPGVAAILFTRGHDGEIRTYVKEYPGQHAPDVEIIAIVSQAVELANL